MANALEYLHKELGEHRVKTDELMSLHTTFKVGGPAQYYFEAETGEDVVKAVRTAITLNIPYLLFGGGSNLLVSDAGILGLVIRNRTKNIKVFSIAGKMVEDTLGADSKFVEADSGIAINYLVRYTIDEGLAGFEPYLGLPGTVGGAVWNNSHFRQPNNEFVGNLVHSAKLLDKAGTIKEVNKFYFKFDYDYSILHDTGEIVLSAVFGLKPGNKEALWELASKQSVQKRHAEQPLEMPSSGCSFQNITTADAIRLSTPNGTQSAGYLIDQAGFKGLQIGNAKVSEKHANFIVNLGGATARDVRDLQMKIKTGVQEKFSVDLKEEIVLVGRWDR